MMAGPDQEKTYSGPCVEQVASISTEVTTHVNTSGTAIQLTGALASTEILALAEAVHKLASVTVRKYSPGTGTFNAAVVAPFGQLYVYGPVPPVTTGFS
jgi:acetylornithine deacetylase/succinyl-diaminopimelate desuccinylase-like protein